MNKTKVAAAIAKVRATHRQYGHYNSWGYGELIDQIADAIGDELDDDDKDEFLQQAGVS